MKAIFEPYMHIVNVAHSAQVLRFLARSHAVSLWYCELYIDEMEGSKRWDLFSPSPIAWHAIDLPEVLTREPRVCALLYIIYVRQAS